MSDSELARFRATPLADVFVAFGGTPDPKDPKHNWRVDGVRFSTGVSTDGTQTWTDHHKEIGGGGAIDLVGYLMKGIPPKELAKREHAKDFAEVAAWFRGGSVRWMAHLHKAPVGSAERKTPAPVAAAPKPWPEPTSSKSARVVSYLTQERGIPDEIVNAALRTGELFADRKGNLVFRMRDEALREIGRGVRGTWGTFHSIAEGSAHGITVLGSPQSKTAVFVESPIEALSYLALKGDAMMISTNGSLREIPHRFIEQRLVPRGHTIVAAYNADGPGDSAAEKLMASVRALGGHVTRDRPDPAIGKDWNLILKAQQRGRPPPRAGELADAMTR